MWPNPQFPANMVTFTEEILNEKLHFLCSDSRVCVIENKSTLQTKSRRKRLWAIQEGFENANEAQE